MERLLNKYRILDMIKNCPDNRGRDYVRSYIERYLEGRCVYILNNGKKIFGTICEIIIPLEDSSIEDCLFKITKPSWIDQIDWIGGNSMFYGPYTISMLVDGLKNGSMYVYPTDNDSIEELSFLEYKRKTIERIEFMDLSTSIALLIVLSIFSIFLTSLFLILLVVPAFSLTMHIIARFILRYEKIVIDDVRVG